MKRNTLPNRYAFMIYKQRWVSPSGSSPSKKVSRHYLYVNGDFIYSSLRVKTCHDHPKKYSWVERVLLCRKWHDVDVM